MNFLFVRAFVFFGLSLAFIMTGVAQDKPAFPVQEGDYVAKDFKLGSGESLREDRKSVV